MSVTIIYHFQAVQGKADALLKLSQNARDFGITVAETFSRMAFAKLYQVVVPEEVML